MDSKALLEYKGHQYLVKADFEPDYDEKEGPCANCGKATRVKWYIRRIRICKDAEGYEAIRKGPYFNALAARARQQFEYYLCDDCLVEENADQEATEQDMITDDLF